MTNTKDPKRAMDSSPVTSNSAAGPVTFSQVFGQQCQLMEAAVQSLHTLNDQISHFIVNKSKTLDEDEDAFLPSEKESLKNSMSLMRHLLMDAQAGILSMMDDNKQLALRIEGAIQAAGQEVTSLRAELSATSRRLAELGGPGPGPGPGPAEPALMDNSQHGAQGQKLILEEERSY
ncbi:kazrin [Alligator mississippiensis]|uniref:Kazrin n=1 Tax=Alligator mississippiensis TaxID=8496 RepID=A0A151M7I7_ALLMI|nr:kazrin [Alligator mississippiensis]